MTSRRRTWITAGLLYRRELREFFLRRDMPYTETKNWLDSFFVYYGTDEEIMILTRWVRKING